jgi:two-component system, cell cycle response regulator
MNLIIVVPNKSQQEYKVIKMSKYQMLLIQLIQKKMGEYSQANVQLTDQEVHHFLGLLKGLSKTCRSSEWDELTQQAEKEVNERLGKTWNSQELVELFAPLLEAAATQAQFVEQPENSSEWGLMEDKSVPVIFVIDQDINFLHFIKGNLEKEGWNIIPALDYDGETIQNINEWRPDCLIMDFQILLKDHFQYSSLLEEQALSLLAPVILISEYEDKVSKMNLIKYADDSIKKPIDYDELIHKIKYQLKRKNKVSEICLIDPLTGTYNVKFLYSELTRQLSRLKRTKESFTIALLDIDGFKFINQMYGYTKANQLLKTFTTFIQQSVRQTDYLFRVGGDEFILILPETNRTQAKLLLQRLLKDFSQTEFSFPNESSSFFSSFSSSIVEIRDGMLSLEECLFMTWHTFNQKAKERNALVEYDFDNGLLKQRKKEIRIAIIDDDMLMRQILLEQLSDFGSEMVDVEVKAFADGVEFFADQWHNQAFSYLLIVDGIMPRMDGMEILQKIRQSYERKKYTIMMLTSRQLEDDISSAIQMGADDYLIKPFSLKELHARVKRLIRGL